MSDETTTVKKTTPKRKAAPKKKTTTTRRRQTTKRVQPTDEGGTPATSTAAKSNGRAKGSAITVPPAESKEIVIPQHLDALNMEAITKAMRANKQQQLSVVQEGTETLLIRDAIEVNGKPSELQVKIKINRKNGQFKITTGITTTQVDAEDAKITATTILRLMVMVSQATNVANEKRKAILESQQGGQSQQLGLF